jgi:hypothetical protein
VRFRAARNAPYPFLPRLVIPKSVVNTHPIARRAQRAASFDIDLRHRLPVFAGLVAHDAAFHHLDRAYAPRGRVSYHAAVRALVGSAPFRRNASRACCAGPGSSESGRGTMRTRVIDSADGESSVHPRSLGPDRTVILLELRVRGLVPDVCRIPSLLAGESSLPLSALTIHDVFRGLP